MKNLKRLLALIVVCAALGWVYANFGGRVREIYEKRAYPSIRSDSPLAEDLKRSVEARRDREYLQEFRRVSAKLQDASARGHDVSRLASRMPSAARLGRRRKYKWGKVLLNSIEVRIPRETTPVVRAADSSDSYLGERK